jgi:hypothetical protein
MIHYIEKGAGLHQAVQKAGHWLRQENGTWVSSNDAAVQAIIDAYDPLPEAKAAKWEAIKVERDKRKNAGFLVQGNRFHSDPDSRIQQLGLVMMGAGVPAGLQWKTIGGSFVTMTPALAQSIFTATAQADSAIFAAAETHRATVDAMTDLAAIVGYDFSGGWPSV